MPGAGVSAHQRVWGVIFHRVQFPNHCRFSSHFSSRSVPLAHFAAVEVCGSDRTRHSTNYRSSKVFFLTCEVPQVITSSILAEAVSSFDLKLHTCQRLPALIVKH